MSARCACLSSAALSSMQNNTRMDNKILAALCLSDSSVLYKYTNSRQTVSCNVCIDTLILEHDFTSVETHSRLYLFSRFVPISPNLRRIDLGLPSRRVATNSPVFVLARTLVALLSNTTKFNADMRSPLQEGRFCCARFWREGHLQALNDINTRWRTGGFWLLVVVWSFGLCLSLIILSLLTDVRLSRGNSFAACQPDGNFYVYPSHYQYWSRSGFFQITLGYGNLSFTQVKVIDILWDIVSVQFQLIYCYYSPRADI